MAVGLLFQEGV